MQKETVLAKVRVTMGFSEDTLGWLERAQNEDIWFAKQGGSPFFSEFRGVWNEILINSTEPIIKGYFLEIGLPEKHLPRVKISESYSGSWIIEASIIMFSTIGSKWAILKGLSELPKIVDGLNELKTRLKKEFSKNASEKVNELLLSSSQKHKLLKPPSKLLNVDFTIDARPLAALSPSAMKSHKVHLNVAISRDAFTLENLGQDIISDIRIGIFTASQQRNQWNLGESFMGTIDFLSSHQTMTKELDNFRDSSGNPLIMSGTSPLHVDCWVQDSHGIYLFMFYLED